VGEQAGYQEAARASRPGTTPLDAPVERPREPREPLERRETWDLRETREWRELREAREAPGTRGPRETREERESRELGETRETRQARTPQEPRKPREPRAARDLRAPRETWGEPRELREALETAPAKRRRGLRVAGLVLAVALVSGLAGGVAGVVATREDAGSGQRAGAAVTEAERAREQLQGVLGAVLPAVVKVEARTDTGKATGSGVIFGASGYVLTNAHVVDEARSLSVTLSTSEPLRARLVGRDVGYDLAVLRVRRAGLPVAQFGRSADLRVGDPAIVVGSPFGFQGSVTTGVVSALHRVVNVPDGQGVGDGRELIDAIQTDAAINPGNSGGALADTSGRVVGISTAIATNGDAESNAGVGFAIPIEDALEVARALVDRKPVPVPFVGVETDRELSPDDVDRYRLGNHAGALVSRIQPRSPAATAGVRQGDLILRFGDRAVRARDQLTVAVHQAKVGVPVPVTVLRRGRQLVLQVVPTDQPDG
jgi:S1-C subfamily serine protease